MSARLLFRVEPVAGESPRGYLCRAAHAHGYCSPVSLAQIAGLQASCLDREDTIKQLSYALRLDPEEWRSMCYHHVKGRNRFKQRSFYGERVSADDLNYKRPRLCSACLRERPIWWAVWDLGIVVACPIHHCLLFNQCPTCKRRVAWRRPAVHKCRCGLDFRDLAPKAAGDSLVAIHAAIYRAAGFTARETARLDLADSGFPLDILRLKLGALLRLILFVGSIKDGSTLRRKQRPFAATDLAAATEICCGAVTLLQDWPQPLREVLRRMVPQAANPAALNFSEIFGNFYRHLFRVLPRWEFGFLHEVFEQFVIEDWQGFIRGQHRYFSAATRRNSHWMPAHEAEGMARTRAGRISNLVRHGRIEGMFLSVCRDGSRIECWIRRDSLKRWMAARDAERARYMSRTEATGALGLTDRAIAKVATAGAIRYVKGPEQNLPSGFFFFLREDIMKIRRAFEKLTPPLREYSKPGELIALRHAMTNYLGRHSGLAGVIRAVVDGNLTPVGYTKRFPGITGYLFLSEQLRKYRPVSGISVPPEGFLSYGEAGALLGVKTAVIRGLVEQGILNAQESRNGFAKLVPTGDVQRFADQHLSATVLAKLLKLDFRSLPRFLRQAGVPVLAIPIIGKGQTRFVRKEIAVNLRMPELTPRTSATAKDTSSIVNRKRRRNHTIDGLNRQPGVNPR